MKTFHKYSFILAGFLYAAFLIDASSELILGVSVLSVPEKFELSRALAESGFETGLLIAMFLVALFLPHVTAVTIEFRFTNATEVNDFVSSVFEATYTVAAAFVLVAWISVPDAARAEPLFAAFAVSLATFEYRSVFVRKLKRIFGPMKEP